MHWLPYLWGSRFLSRGQTPRIKPLRSRDEKAEQIAAVEARWGIRFPAEFVAQAMDHEGETPEPGIFVDKSGCHSCINCFYIFEEDPAEYNIVRVHAELSDQLPPNVFPIACDPGGNDICLDYRQSDAPSVWFYDHGELRPIAASFSEFLLSLVVDVESTKPDV